jgi:flagellar hook-length control protein FliK
VPAADAAALAGLTVIDARPAATGAATAADAPVDGAAPAPATGAPLPVAGAGGSLGAGAGGADRDPSSDSSTGDGVPDVTSTGTASATVAAPADVDAATGTAASQPVAAQVARHVAVLRGGPDGAHTMTLVLTPESLGPVEVQVTISQNTVDLTLRGAHEQGRAALLDALPDLRRDLETAGLSCSRLEVDREAGGSWLERHAAQQQTPGDRGGQQTPGDSRSRPWQRTADSSDDRTAPTSQRSTSSGVDVRV